MTDTQRAKERDAIEAAFADQLSQMFAVLCDDLAINDESKFAEGLTIARRARDIALAAIEQS